MGADTWENTNDCAFLLLKSPHLSNSCTVPSPCERPEHPSPHDVVIVIIHTTIIGGGVGAWDGVGCSIEGRVVTRGPTAGWCDLSPEGS